VSLPLPPPGKLWPCPRCDSKPRYLSETSQRPIFTKFGHETVSRRGIRKDIFENFHLRGHLPPKSEIENRSNRHFTQSRLQVTWCTAEIYCLCLLRVIVQGPGTREFPSRSIFLYDVRLRSYGASKLPNFRIFAYFPHTKRLKTYLPVTSLQPRGYIAEWFRFFHVVVEGPKGCLHAAEFSCASGRGAGDPQTCQNFRLWQMPVSIQNALCNCTARPIWTKYVWKRAILRTNVFSDQIYLPLPPRSPQNAILGDLSMQNLLYSHTLMELWRWNFTAI